MITDINDLCMTFKVIFELYSVGDVNSALFEDESVVNVSEFLQL